MVMMRRVFSGIQPTGIPHIGNYFGAMQPWVHSINNNDNDNSSLMFCIVDLHALTTNTSSIKEQTLDMAASMLGVGINPSKCTFFKQSDVSAHAELMWTLSCVTPLPYLHRMTQYKSKSNNNNSNNNLGLLSYPVLMAADILLYNATHVPVGEDQAQHLELARTIAGAFNNVTKQNIFIKPTAMINDGSTARVLSLKDPLRKMSKSEGNANSKILLTDSADEISIKIRKATTDSVSGISYDRLNRPGVSNLLSILSAVSRTSVDDLISEHGRKSMGEFKKVVTDNLVQHLVPIGKKTLEYRKDEEYLQSVLQTGASEASNVSRDTMKKVYNAIGI